MSVYTLFIEDPIAAIELLTVVFTLLYMFKLAFRGNSDKPHCSRSSIFSSTLQFGEERFLWSLFSVGSLISIPKRSLSYQQLR